CKRFIAVHPGPRCAKSSASLRQPVAHGNRSCRAVSTCPIVQKSRCLRVFRIGLFSLLLLSAAVAAAQPPTDEATAIGRYFEGLRQRGLFDLAEGEALRRLDEKPAPAAHARLVAELARTFTEHAKYVTGREQADLWARA